MKNSDILISTKRKFTFQNENKKKWTDELIIAYRQLAFQMKEKEKRAAEFIKVSSENGICPRLK